MPNVSINKSLQAGIQRDMSAMWEQEFPKFEAVNKTFIRDLPFVNLRKATYVFKDSIPFPVAWQYGMPRTYQLFKDRSLDISVYPFEMSIPISNWDVQDDQLGDYKSHIQLGVQRFLQLPAKLVSEHLNGAASLLPGLSPAYDGVGLFSATEGDPAARFCAIGGNILTSSGLTVAGVAHDMARAQQQFMAFRDPASQPIFDEASVEYTKLTAVIPTALNELFQKVTKSEFLRTDLTNTVSESNYLKGTFNYVINPYLTDASDWFITVDHPFYKPLAVRRPKETRQIWADMSNSDRAREYNEEYFYVDMRIGIAPFFPAAAIMINS
jgi:hypothetical protein